MINGKKVLAIIPARAGSKRVKDKNLKYFLDKPLIAWTLEELERSKYIDDSFVSTDSPEIQKLAMNYSVDSHPLRSPELSSDKATSVDVIEDVLKNVKKDNQIFILLQPTSPLRKIEDVDKALEFFIAKKASSVISVCETKSHPSWMSPLPESLLMDELIKKIQTKRSQDLEPQYRLNGGIYLGERKIFLEKKSFFILGSTYAYIMNVLDSVDIDNNEDFTLAEAIARLWKFKEDQ